MTGCIDLEDGTIGRFLHHGKSINVPEVYLFCTRSSIAATTGDWVAALQTPNICGDSFSGRWGASRRGSFWA